MMMMMMMMITFEVFKNTFNDLPYKENAFSL